MKYKTKKEFLDTVVSNYKDQKEFHQAVEEVDSITGSTLIAIHNGEDAGQEIPHIHVHLVPRSKSDSAGPIHSMFNSSLELSDSDTEKYFNLLKI